MGTANVTTAGVVRQTIEWAWMLGLTTLAFALLRNHTSIITFPTPLDYYEGTVPLVTGLIARGIDPYGLAQQPVYAYVYPPLYNLIVAPLTLVFGNTFLVHRLVSAAFIAADSSPVRKPSSRDILNTVSSSRAAQARTMDR